MLVPSLYLNSLCCEQKESSFRMAVMNSPELMLIMVDIWYGETKSVGSDTLQTWSERRTILRERDATQNRPWIQSVPWMCRPGIEIPHVQLRTDVE